MARKKIAVFFGERSFEHDISILTGLQAIKVIDQTKFETFPIYIDLERNWWTGEGLLNQSNYPLGKKLPKDIRRVRFVVGEGKGYIETVSKGIFRNNNREYFDAAFLAFHGDFYHLMQFTIGRKVYGTFSESIFENRFKYVCHTAL